MVIRPLLGWIPESRVLENPTIREIFRRIERERIIPPDSSNENKRVHQFLIGAMTAQTASYYLKKIPFNNALITGSDRSEMIRGAFNTNTSVLILTGIKEPESDIISTAKRKNIPILLIPQETYSISQQLGSIVWHISPDNKSKIEEAKKLVRENINLKILFSVMSTFKVHIEYLFTLCIHKSLSISKGISEKKNIKF